MYGFFHNSSQQIEFKKGVQSLWFQQLAGFSRHSKMQFLEFSLDIAVSIPRDKMEVRRSIPCIE
jgi:4-alpha-glucanotransferase